MKYLLAPLFLVMTLSACAPTGKVVKPDDQVDEQPARQTQQQPVIAPGPKLGVVAVSQIQLEHPSAKLYFTENSVRDTLIQQLHQSDRFDVVDWTRLRDVLMRSRIKLSDLETQQQARQTAASMLHNDAFLVASITSFGERMEFTPSRMSKERFQTAEVGVELLLKDALSNQVISSAKGNATRTKTIGATAAFGPAGGTDTSLASRALEQAINQGLADLIARLDRSGHRFATRTAPVPAQDTRDMQNDSLAGKQFLLIFSDSGRSSSGNAQVISVSKMEQYLGAALTAKGGQVQTADGVIGKAYGMSGGEDLILGGYLTEQDFQQLESLYQARRGLSKYALQVARSARAEFVVSGTLTLDQGNRAVAPGVEAPFATASVTAKVIRVANGSTLGVITDIQSYTDITAATMQAAITGALQRVAESAADKVQELFR